MSGLFLASSDWDSTDAISARRRCWQAGFAARKTGFQDMPPVVTSRFAKSASSIVWYSCSCVIVPFLTAEHMEMMAARAELAELEEARACE